MKLPKLIEEVTLVDLFDLPHHYLEFSLVKGDWRLFELPLTKNYWLFFFAYSV
jgi:hypothetical protein